MTKLELLEQLLGDKDGWVFAGIKGTLKIDDERVVETSFPSSGTHNQYTSLLVVLVNKKSGEITRNIFPFADYGIDNHIWKGGRTCGRWEWYKDDKLPAERFQKCIWEWIELYN